MIELIAILSLILHKYVDVGIALGLLCVNAILSFVQEQRASAAVAALRSRLQVTSRVLREGNWSLVSARELVPGDVVRVRTGDFVPADLQILDGELPEDPAAFASRLNQLVQRGLSKDTG